MLSVYTTRVKLGGWWCARVQIEIEMQIYKTTNIILFCYTPNYAWCGPLKLNAQFPFAISEFM